MSLSWMDTSQSSIIYRKKKSPTCNYEKKIKKKRKRKEKEGSPKLNSIGKKKWASDKINE